MQTTSRLVLSFQRRSVVGVCNDAHGRAVDESRLPRRNVRGASVLVACEAPDLTVQRICEDQLAAAVPARGAKPTLNSQLSAAGTPPAGTDPYLAAAKRVGARAIVR